MSLLIFVHEGVISFADPSSASIGKECAFYQIYPPQILRPNQIQPEPDLSPYWKRIHGPSYAKAQSHILDLLQQQKPLRQLFIFVHECVICFADLSPAPIGKESGSYQIYPQILRPNRIQPRRDLSPYWKRIHIPNYAKARSYMVDLLHQQKPLRQLSCVIWMAAMYHT